LHGLGFASGLSEAGLPPDHIPFALALFSVGVEIGHFGFIAAVFTSIALGRRAIRRLRSSPLRPQHLAVLRVLPAYAIGGVAMFWLIERIAAFRGV
jgi:HupE/UreJ protein